jgi:hypothetical protein
MTPSRSRPDAAGTYGRLLPTHHGRHVLPETQSPSLGTLNSPGDRRATAPWGAAAGGGEPHSQRQSESRPASMEGASRMKPSASTPAASVRRELRRRARPSSTPPLLMHNIPARWRRPPDVDGDPAAPQFQHLYPTPCRFCAQPGASRSGTPR